MSQNVVLYNDSLLQNWPRQHFPPTGYVFPNHSKKRWTFPNGSLIRPHPLLIPNNTGVRLVRFDFQKDVREMGMPCFGSELALKEHPKWHEYFLRVYGSSPTSFPLCVSQFSQFYYELGKSLNISLPPLQYDICEADGHRKRLRSWSKSNQPSWIVYLLHYDHPRSPLPQNAWVEVMHHHRNWFNGFERQGMWFTAASGSGVWLNTGRTIAFRDHGEAFAYFMSHWETDLAVNAKEFGFDTIQFTHGDGMTHHCCKKLRLKPNCFGLELMSTGLVGNYACGGPTSFNMYRSGWNAERPCQCTEDNVDVKNRPTSIINCMNTASHALDTTRGAKKLRRARQAEWSRVSLRKKWHVPRTFKSSLAL
jgi:hypothetical protein